MTIRVIITKELDEDFWGAEDALIAGGGREVIDLVKEDIPALLDGATFAIEIVKQGRKP